jgi:DNA-directed RNA polymerase subunit N (RpoN/RPB10)
MDQNDTVSAIPISRSLSHQFYKSCWNLIAAVYKNIRVNFLPGEYDNRNTIMPKVLRLISLKKICCKRVLLYNTKGYLFDVYFIEFFFVFLYLRFFYSQTPLLTLCDLK